MSPRTTASGNQRVGLTGAVLGDFGQWLDELPAWAVVAASVAIVLGVAAVDAATGNEIDLSVFYLGPVVLVTWFVSGWAGVIFALVAAFLWTAIDPGGALFSNSLIPFWNTLVRVAFFMVTVFLVTLARRAIVSERLASRTDSLTGVANSRAFSDRATLAIADMHRSREPMTFCYVDLDHFKRVNDTLGHREGDALLVVLTEAMSSRLRATDLVARLGGDEFGILLPDTGYEAAERVIADLRESIAEAVSNRWPVGITAGAITFMQPPTGVDQMVGLADGLMYAAKRAGRGRIEHDVWPEEGAYRPAAVVDPGAEPGFISQ